MTVYDTLNTTLTNLGYKVFPIKKLDSVKTAITYNVISSRIIGSMSGSSTLCIERIQINCYAIAENTLKNMVTAVEHALAYHDEASFTSIPTETKIEGFDKDTSTFYSFRDYMFTF